jgi:uncharacterized protein
MSAEGGPFHAGERAVQARAGSAARMEVAGPRLIRDHMLDEHRELFEKLPYLVAGVADGGGQPWATLLTGPPGLVTTTARTMQIAALPAAADPARGALRPGVSVGILGIELSTRRRNRMNGLVRQVDDTGFALDVVQSFGNCPKYVHLRRHRPSPAIGPASFDPEGPRLSAEALALIARADTFFIATTSGAQAKGASSGTDVSHRGGAPGFVSASVASKETVLTVPDYVGNGFFNTLGNLALDPRAGLLFVDFEAGHLLQLSVRGRLDWADEKAPTQAGTNRSLSFAVTGGHWLRNALALRWEPVGDGA